MRTNSTIKRTSCQEEKVHLMVLDAIRNLVADKEPTPNQFTMAMGHLIRKARKDEGLSQAELGVKLFRRRATISDIETGKVEINSSTLALLAASLRKPITYFFPANLYHDLKKDELTPLEQELILYYRNVFSDHLRIVINSIVRDMSLFDPHDMFVDYSSTIEE